MDMDSSTAQFHHQEIGSQTLESMLIPTKTQTEKKPKPSEQALKCPRCDSTNTKFCYYNNYSLSQPRYFCKSCRRYWTKGGTLRNVPVGGGCRKTTKRSSSKRSSHIDQPITRNPSPIPSYTSPLSYESQVFQSGVQHLHAGLDDFRNPNTHVSGFLEAPLGFYYGMNGDHGVGQMGLEINGGISGLNQEMGLMGFEDIMISGATTTSTAVATVKQEIGRSEDGEINGRSMWGFQWQNVMGGEGNMGSNWNGIGSSNWHGLLNTPLM